MRQLVYLHQNVPPMVVAVYRLVHRAVLRLLNSGTGRRTLDRRQQRRLAVAGVVISLVLQLVILWLAYWLADLCISLMEVWAELATYHFALTSSQGPVK